MQYTDELKNRVRVLADYDTQVLSDADLVTLMDIAVSDLEARVAAAGGDTSTIDWETAPAENALFWTSCLFTKIKAGELDGVPMSLSDMEIEALRTGSEESVMWYRRAMKYANSLESDVGGASSGTGHRSSIGRHEYSNEPQSFYD